MKRKTFYLEEVRRQLANESNAKLGGIKRAATVRELAAEHKKKKKYNGAEICKKETKLRCTRTFARVIQKNFIFS